MELIYCAGSVSIIFMKKKMRRLRILKQIGLFLIGATALYAVLGFLIVPWYVRGPLAEGLSERIGGTVSFERVRMNPFSFTFETEEFQVREDGSEVIGVGSLRVDLAFWRSLFRRSIVLSDISVNNPRLFVDVRSDGGVNLADAFAATEEKAVAEEQEDMEAEESAEDPLARLEAMANRYVLYIDRLAVSEGTVRFRDQRLQDPFDLTFDHLQFDLEAFVSDPEARTPYSFVARSGEDFEFAWEGVFSIFPLRSEAEVRVSGLEPGVFQAYLDEILAFDFRSGAAGFAFHYIFAPLDPTPRMAIPAFTFTLSDVLLGMNKEDAVFFAMPLLRLEDMAFELNERSLSAGKVSIEIEHVGLQRDADGTVNVLNLVRSNAATDNIAGGTSSDARPTRLPEPSLEAALAQLIEAMEAAWAIKADVFELRLIGAEFRDAIALEEPLRVAEVTISAENLANFGEAPMQMQIAGALGDGGRFEVTGTLATSFNEATFSGKVSGIDGVPFFQFFNPGIPLSLVSGSAAASVNLEATFIEEVLSYSVRGDAEISDLSVVDPATGEAVLEVAGIRLRGLSLESEGPTFRLGEMLLTGPMLAIEREADGTLNLQRFLSALETGPSDDRETPAADVATDVAVRTSPTVTVERLQLSDGKFVFRERFLDPSTDLVLEQIELGMEPIHWDSETPAAFNLRARAATGGTFQIEGTIVPSMSELVAELAVGVTHFALLPTSTYSSNFVGYPIAGGSLTSSTRFTLEGLRFETMTDLTLNRFDLSREPSGKASLPVPVHLGISLLKDRNERIDLRRINVHGDFADPETEVRTLVVQAIVRIVGNLVSRPFALLGSAFGGREEALEAAFFEPGLAELKDESAEAIQVLVDALFERPELVLILVPMEPSESDLLALAEFALREQLAARAEAERREQRSALRTMGWQDLEAAEALASLANVYLAKIGEPPAPPTPEATMGLTPDAARVALLSQLQAEASDEVALQALVQERLDVVQTTFLSSGRLTDERIRIADAVEPAGKEPSVAFRLE
jgi:hypothetical protein